MTQPAKTKNLAMKSSKRRQRLTAAALLLSGATLLGWFACGAPANRIAAPRSFAAGADELIETAIYARRDFFSAQAIVPLPTAEARENLAGLAAAADADPRILDKLAEYDEKLLRFDEAETLRRRLAEIDSANLETLAEFYERRGNFAAQAEVLRQILLTARADQRAAAFERLIRAARKHDLKDYLQPAFYAQTARDNAEVFPVYERLIDICAGEQNYPEALNFVRQAQSLFPDRKSELLDREIEMLLAAGDRTQAEKVYRAAFDPLWSDDEAEKFYQFLNSQNRLRGYGTELKTRFTNNPADFDAAVRFASYRNHDYAAGGDSAAQILARLEQAKKAWTTNELVTVTRLLIKSDEAESASRFLYTLFARDDFKSDSHLRAQILYQLFEMFSDAETRRLPLTKGDLGFYRDVARADVSPGITTGILSLIFSDSKIGAKFEEAETKAVKHFNRAAAYRIFEEYKKENPGTNELAQMYLDLVRLSARLGERETAENILGEFAGSYAHSADYAAAALRLADAYSAVKQEDNARRVYGEILDYLGGQGKAGEANRAAEGVAPNENSPKRPERNRGINLPGEKTARETYYDRDATGTIQDRLGDAERPVTYREVLERYVASLAAERKTADVLRLYSDEIGKYPDQQWLYVQRLTWLEQAHLTADQLELYKSAAARFQTADWRNRLARFFLRLDQNDEFARYSADLLNRIGDAEARDYLTEFEPGNSPTAFEKQLFLKLYQSAHNRFPHDSWFTVRLLNFYRRNRMDAEWRAMCAEYYFESPEIRRMFLDDLARANQLREYLDRAKNADGAIYDLFRADAGARLSDYEGSVAAYRRLDELYPNTPAFRDRLINFSRSLGQKDRSTLAAAAELSNRAADYELADAARRISAGEIYAELGDDRAARLQWEKLVDTARGEKEIYLETATVYWDYFQFGDALDALARLREKFGDRRLYAFETGAILEARNQVTDAVGEYVKALGGGEDDSRKEKAIKRLVRLAARPPSAAGEPDGKTILKSIAAAFDRERGRQADSCFLTLGYAEFLVRRKQPREAENILRRVVAGSANRNFLDAARNFFERENNRAGVQHVLARSAEIADSPRRTISFRLQLAQSFEENLEPDRAKAVLDRLVNQFPTNYGVLTETANFYGRLGDENRAAQILTAALPKSRGAYRSDLARRLTARLIKLDRFAAAERILTELHAENKGDLEIFRELVNVCVRAGKPAEMRRAFDETIAELKNSAADQRETQAAVADLREEMIDAFTRLKDYRSAAAQHIEIINRDPADEQLTDNAVAYVERYGGAETLLAYYEKLAAESFKNYRWNVVLARLYAARGDAGKALENYRAAAAAQPELPELYAAIADLEVKRGGFDEALKNLDEVLKLTDNRADFVKMKIETLKKAGRFAEIEAEKAKLPAEVEVNIPVNKFAEAEKFLRGERERARAMYREAFAALLENPLSEPLNQADIAGFVRSARADEPFDALSRRLWTLRDKLTDIAAGDDPKSANEAARRRQILDYAIVEAIGDGVRNQATDEELANLESDLRGKITEIQASSDKRLELPLIQNLSRRAGFGTLEELILIGNADRAVRSSPDQQSDLNNLVNFYRRRGAFQKALAALARYGSRDWRLSAETAQLAGDLDRELDALRHIYAQSAAAGDRTEDAAVTRYLELLLEHRPGEIESLIGENAAPRRLQLINFLLRKNLPNLAHRAIENSNFDPAWKIARRAETSLYLREFGEDAECLFCGALRLDIIGETIRQTPDKRQFPAGDDWFRLSREYGEWLANTGDAAAPKYLPAMIENLPRSADEQFKLGEFYLARGEAKSAVEHLRLAAESGDRAAAISETTRWATLGAAYYKVGRADYADQCWQRTLGGADANAAGGATLLEVSAKYGLSRQARERVAPIIVKMLQTTDADDSPELQNLIRRAAASFDDENEKSAFFRLIVNQRLADVSLAAMLVGENLIAPQAQPFFYETLIARSRVEAGYDYEFADMFRRRPTTADAESVYDQENDYQDGEPSGDWYERREQYLKLLIELGENARAREIIGDLEKQLSGRSARPARLRAAKIRLDIRAGKIDRAQIKSFVGIAVSENAPEIIPPSLERFNDAAQILKDENRPAELLDLTADFYARMLALKQFEANNFANFAAALFEKNDPENALLVLRLMTAAGGGSARPAALARLAELKPIAAAAADPAKIPAEDAAAFPFDSFFALDCAARTAKNSGRRDAAEDFRRELLAANPENAANKLELAKLSIEKGDTAAAQNLSAEIINDKNTARRIRLEARQLIGTPPGDVLFDAFSQFYQGAQADGSGRKNAAAEFYVNALIADSETETSALHNLIAAYVKTGKYAAAFRLADDDRTAKSDELLAELSDAAEKIKDYQRAAEYEKNRRAPNRERVRNLEKLAAANASAATDFKVDAAVTKKL